jgi:hypothetical protein
MWPLVGILRRIIGCRSWDQILHSTTSSIAGNCSRFFCPVNRFAMMETGGQVKRAAMPFANLSREAAMTQQRQHRRYGAARPIRTKRDYLQAGEAVKRLNDNFENESAAELRLQALIREMERYDDDEADDFDSDYSFEFENGGPCRRWSDDPNDLD